MFQKSIFYILGLFVLFFVSCHDDIDGPDSIEVINGFTAQVYQEITGSIVGYVYDENNQPIGNATVATYSTTVKTNDFGVFVMKNIKLDQQGTYLKVVKDGFILGSDFVYPSKGKISYSYVKMMKLETGKTFESESGGTISAVNGGKIIFPAGAIVDRQGKDYKGVVNVTAKYLNPKSKDLGNLMPGGLMGDAANGNTVILGTLGMMAVVLLDDSGQSLQIKNGSLATIEFPLVTDYRPSQVPLWSFDENKGRWKEEGMAILEGDKYIAKVSHFSFWNCDAPFPLIEVCGKVIFEDGEAAKNTGIIVEVEGLGASYGMTNDEGMFCGKMPKGKRLTFSIRHFNCEQTIVKVEVGPFENNTLLNDIKINKISSYKINGKLHCNNSVVEEGILIVKIKDFSYVFAADESGAFSIDLTNYLCNEILPVSIFGFDNNSSAVSQTETFASAPNSDISLNVCQAGCNMQAVLNYDCSNILSAAVTGGSGNYNYKWEDNSTGSSIAVLNPDSIFEMKVYCVTITDVIANCSKVFCKSVNGALRVGIENDCRQGRLLGFHFGGSEPFTYSWSNGSVDREITASQEGKYCLTVTDVNGCSNFACVDVEIPIDFNPNPTACKEETYSFFSSLFQNGYYFVNGTNLNGSLGYPMSVNIFNTGFNFNLVLNSVSCSFSYVVKLPQLIQGLTTTVVNTTCDTCTNGKINININNNATCFECKVGATRIFKINDIKTDVSNLNNSGELPRGEYYVVVTDANNGCYIAYNKVKIL